MNNSEYASKLDELDYLLNEPDAEPQPERIWEILAALSHHDLAPPSPD